MVSYNKSVMRHRNRNKNKKGKNREDDKEWIGGKSYYDTFKHLIAEAQEDHRNFESGAQHTSFFFPAGHNEYWEKVGDG